MTFPHRGRTSESTYFVTTSTWEKKNILQSERMAGLLIDVLQNYRAQQKYLLHEFVIMPNHFHLLITPVNDTTLERAMQLIKGGFSFRAQKELGIQGEIWQTSFFDRRIRDAAEYQKYKEYIWQNPVAAGLTGSAREFPFSSATGKFELDDLPQRLKPLSSSASMQA